MVDLVEERIGVSESLVCQVDEGLAEQEEAARVAHASLLAVLHT